MIILTNALAQRDDEGCLKVAKSLIKRMKAKNPHAYVVTYERESELSDAHLHLNKFLLNPSLKKLLKANGGPLFYLPFPAKAWKTALRVFILSLLSGHKLSVCMVMRAKQGLLAKFLLKISRATVVTLSADSAAFYESVVGHKKVFYLKAGVDTQQFVPVDRAEKQALRRAYGLDANRPVVLHVGHLQEGRNLRALLALPRGYQVLLVASSFNKPNHDLSLKERLAQAPNLQIIEGYLPRVQELYQLADVYFFPVQDQNSCIDLPLSCMEAAACGVPVVTTEFGEMAAFRGREGFYFIDSFEPKALADLLEKAMAEHTQKGREVAMEYDWNKAVERFTP